MRVTSMEHIRGQREVMHAFVRRERMERMESMGGGGGGCPCMAGAGAREGHVVLMAMKHLIGTIMSHNAGPR